MFCLHLKFMLCPMLMTSSYHQLHTAVGSPLYIQAHTYICVYTPGVPLWGGYGVYSCVHVLSLSCLTVTCVCICTVLSLKVDWDTWDIYWEIAKWRLTGGSPICLMATEWSICIIKLPKLPEFYFYSFLATFVLKRGAYCNFH